MCCNVGSSHRKDISAKLCLLSPTSLVEGPFWEIASMFVHIVVLEFPIREGRQVRLKRLWQKHLGLPLGLSGGEVPDVSFTS